MTEPVATIPRPPNEAARLAALHRLGIVGTPPEERFDRIVRLTARLFRVPYAYLSLVDDHTQWIKSQEGACTLPSSRERSFCGHAILSATMLVVPDALQDPRFMDHPLVTGEPYVRFYAGRPLEVEPNCCVGSLCIVDREPRRLTETETELFDQLGDLVEHELRLVDLVELQDKLIDCQTQLAEERRRNEELIRGLLPARILDEIRRNIAVTAARQLEELGPAPGGSRPGRHEAT